MFMNAQRKFAICGMIAPLLFWLTYFMLSSIRNEYSFLTKAVSELGSVDVPHKMLWNWFGYIIPGSLIVIFSYGLLVSIAWRDGSRLPMIALSLSGVFMALSGFFPGDFDNRQSVTMIVHTIGSFGSYLFFLIAAFTFPRLMQKSKYWSKIIITTRFCVWLTILFGLWVISSAVR